MSAVREEYWDFSDGILRFHANEMDINFTAEEIYNLVFENQNVIHGYNLQNNPLPGQLQFSSYPVLPELQIQLDSSGMLTVVLIIKSDSGKRTFNSIKQIQSDHIIINEHWYPFVQNFKQELFVILDTLGMEDIGHLTFGQYLQLKKLSRQHEWIHDQDFSAEHLIFNEVSEEKLYSFTGRLYPYQRTGWKWLNYIWKEQLGAILADEMGLGKTIQLIALLSSPDRQSIAPGLIIAPSSLLENWRRELLKFSPKIKSHIHQGQNRTGNYKDLITFDVIITSYDTVVRDASMFAMYEWKIIILDEAQAIKNPETKRARSVKSLPRKVGIAVTGTPIENRLQDLWSLVDFAVPDYLGTQKQFETTFESSLTGAQDLEPFVSPIMLRRRVAEVASDLPPRIDFPQALLMTEFEAENYERIRTEINQQYGKSASLVALTKLRMFCAHPFLLEDNNISTQTALDFSKFERLFQIAEEIFENNQKVIIFTSYNRMADLISKTAIENYGVYSNIINGDTAVIDRQKIVDEFTITEGPGLLALNPKAAGVGLNITAANHVIHYNLEWNPAVEDQASARSHRRGQTLPVTVHRLFYSNTVEEVIDDRLQRKRNLAETAIVGVQGNEDDYADIINSLKLTPVGK